MRNPERSQIQNGPLQDETIIVEELKQTVISVLTVCHHVQYDRVPDSSHISCLDLLFRNMNSGYGYIILL